MNHSVIRFILGYVVGFMGLFLMLPVLVAFIYHEPVWFDYAIVAFPCLIIGIANSYFKPKNHSFYLKDGFFCTGASWVVLSVIGALPLYITGEIPHYIDALFESVSGFTTTGASIVDNVERLTHASLFWRSFTHLVGGMGVLVFLLTVIPLAGGDGSQFNLMKAESPGPSVGKLVPKLRNTAQMLYLIYLGLTALEIILLLLAGMTPFEAINTGIATAGTGGFGIYANSIAAFNVKCQWIVAIFMFIFGVNFNFYYCIMFHHVKEAFKMEEVKMYTFLTLTSIGIITFNILGSSAGLFDALTKAAFQVTSIQSSTGFSTADFAVWPQTSRCVLVLLMFIGACAGSTGGGIKVSRFVLMGKAVHKELISYIHPRSVRKTILDGKPVTHDTIRSNNVFFGTFMLTFFVSVFILSFENLDFSTIFTAVIATMSNIGPGMSLVGPAANFAFFSDVSKLVLIFDMLAGRLELFPILMLFHPVIWKDLFSKRRCKELKNAGKILKK
ncbi:TrkH family potassium uptake protein [Pseudobutyrivibrio sp. MD2005]|uniref:TrkH family potassium uptake protein n=1 Tax=Pseudobutyrivibrio sp. MD2005 TaxID=1410616 RepID=UPI000486C0C7|nr:TrkH family potassium uptake protein [Pseudobutyrivibrio sp. MD2005]